MHASTIMKLLHTGKIRTEVDLVCVMDKETDPVILFNSIIQEYNGSPEDNVYGQYGSGDNLSKEYAYSTVFRYLVMNYPDKAEDTFNGITNASVFDVLMGNLTGSGDFVANKCAQIILTKINKDIRPKVDAAYNKMKPVFMLGDRPHGIVGNIIEQQAPFKLADENLSIQSTLKRSLLLIKQSIQNWNASKTIWIDNIHPRALEHSRCEVPSLASTEVRVPIKVYTKEIPNNITWAQRQALQSMSYVSLSVELLPVEVDKKNDVYTLKVNLGTEAVGSSGGYYYRRQYIAHRRNNYCSYAKGTEEIVIEAAKRAVRKELAAYTNTIQRRSIVFLRDHEEFKLLLGAE